MRFLIAGFGSIGRRHLRNLLELGERDIVLLRSQKSTLPTDEISEFPVETDLEKALAHKPDAVIIANPTALHLQVAIPAALAGCSILMEKPLSNSLEGLLDLQKALESGGSRCLVGYQYRFHPGLRKIKEWLNADALGRLTSAQCLWGEYLPDWHPWEDYRQSYAARADLGGGVVNTLSHPFDYIRWLLGEVASLYALTSVAGLYLDVEDTAEITMRMESLVPVSLHLDYLRRPGLHRLELVGTQGSVTWVNGQTSVGLYHAEENTTEVFTYPPGFERNTLFLDELRHFFRVVRNEETPICSLEDGMAAQRLTAAVHASAGSGSVIDMETFAGGRA